jgi:uncharacterized membrane protein YdjX (TVP38/TMEM64 family)
LHGHVGLLLCTCAFWVFGGLALIPTWAYSTLAGWTFGLPLGLASALAGFLGAALVAYGIARRASGHGVIELISEKPKWQAVYDALLAGGFWRTLCIITLIRIPPAPPFAMTNVIMAAARAPVAPFAIGTVLGLAPRTAFVVFTAAGLEQLDFRDPQQSLGPLLLGLAAAAAVILILVALAKRAVDHMTRPEA